MVTRWALPCPRTGRTLAAHRKPYRLAALPGRVQGRTAAVAFPVSDRLPGYWSGAAPLSGYGLQMGIDPRAVSGFSSVAHAYERGRPSYSDAAIARLVDGLDLTADSSVLDLAAGTGQLSRLLRGRVGCVVAVEPMSAMRSRMRASLPDVTVLDGTAEDIPLADREVDAVVVGEAFHWFETTTATQEIARVLKRSGGIALLWNTPTWTVESHPWLDALRRRLAPHKRAAGAYPAGEGSWQTAFARTGLFEPLQHVEALHEQTLGRNDFLAQIASWSWMANLGFDQRQAALDDIDVLVRGHESIAIPYRTDLHLARRRTTQR